MPRHFRSTRSVMAGVAALLMAQGIFGIQVVLALFYRTGAYFIDAGFCVYAVVLARAPSTPKLMATSWGDSVFRTHTTFLPTIVMAPLRPLLAVPLKLIAYLGLQHALFSFSAGYMSGVAAYHYQNNIRRAIIAGTWGAVLLPFSNIAMGSLAYPYVELLGPRLSYLSPRWSHACRHKHRA